MSNVITRPGLGIIKPVSLEDGSALVDTCGTYLASFKAVQSIRSDKPLKRGARHAPAPVVSNSSLLRVAEENRPSPDWYNGDETCPF